MTIPGTYGNFGTNPFTVEAWVYPSSSVGPIFTTHRAGTASGFYFSMSTTNNTMIHGRYYGSNVETASSANAVKLNQWNHLAWCREGTGSNQTRMFANGKVVATYTDDQNYSSAPYGPFVGGYDAGGSQYDVNGNIADLRVVSGTALYTAEFTPPTAPLTAVTNTSLLLQSTGAGIIDKSQSIKALALNGDVKSSTAQYKFLTSSMYFDGTGDYITTNEKILPIDQGIDYTVEGWFWATDVSGYYPIIQQYTTGSDPRRFNILIEPNILKFFIAGSSRATPSISAQTWYHFALTRTGTTHNAYLNGTRAATWTDSTNVADTNTVIGYFATYYYKGHLSDIRFTRGLARYTAADETANIPTASLKG